MTEQSINAIITGGAQRVGRAIALDLATHGFGVIIHANSSVGDAEALAEEIRAEGGNAWAVQADLTDVDQAASVIDQAADKAGHVDILVNNASVFEPDTILELDRALWDTHFALHLKAPAFMSQALATHLDNRDGLIINMIDQRVWRLNPTFFSYTLSKSALWTATRTMAQSLGPNVRVNAIGPGPALKNDRQNDQDFDQQIEALILKRGPELAEFGATVRYLWEAKSVTGQMIALDGGQHLAWKTPDTNAKE